MSASVTPAGPAAGPGAQRPAGAPVWRRLVRLRLVLLGAGSVVLLLALAVVAYALAAARVPQHRAALEDLIRHETGLEVSFRELALRWGWYGPEVVFDGVQLGEPGGRLLLGAPRLIVGLDAWRMARSGHLEAGRITLESPDIDLSAAGGADAAYRSAGAQTPWWSALARVLSRWRGGQIDIVGGTLRAAGPARTPPVVLSLRRVQLHRLGAAWSADAVLLLPESLGAGAHVALQMQGDPSRPQLARGSLQLEGQRLAFPGWRALAADLAIARYLPQQGDGNLELTAQFAGGTVSQLTGTLSAAGLAWAPLAPAGPALALDRLRGEWQLARQGEGWRFSVQSLELAVPARALAGAAATSTAPAAPPASITLDTLAQGAQAHGRMRHAPLAALTAIARWYAPYLPLDALALGGEARELTFDWGATRPQGARLVTFADLQGLSVASASGEVLVSGLTASVSGVGGALVADVQGHDARLAVSHAQPVALAALGISARLTLAAHGGGWRLSSDDLQIRHAGMSLTVSGALGADEPGAPRHIDARLSMKDGDLAVLASLLGPRALATLGAAAYLTAGRIEDAELAWRGPLEGGPLASGAGSRFSGTLAISSARLAAHDDWPAADDIAAHIAWRGPRFRAAVGHAHSGSFELSAASLAWDARGRHALQISGRLAGSAQDALDWLRSHPRLSAWSPGVTDIDLRGNTLLDVEVDVPAATRVHAAAAPARVRLAALLDGAELRPVAGLPPIGALRGTLGFAAGHVQRSTLTGQWLGGPVSLTVAEHREHGAAALAISGRGVMDARQAVQAAGGDAETAQLTGGAEWSALLTLQPAAPGAHSPWALRADSSLVGVASRLPEPFAKAAGAALPLHVELQAGGEAAQLRVSLGDRLRALAALVRSDDTWRIERGAVRLAATAPPLPADAVLLLDGHVGRLDLAAALALWRQAGRDAALPALRARVTAGQLSAASASYPEVSLAAEAAHEAGALQLQSAGLSGTVRWGAPGDARTAVAHLAAFNISQPADLALGAALATALAPVLELDIDDLRWQDRSLGSLSARLSARAGVLDVNDLRLSGADADTYASAHCQERACHVTVSLDSRDAAATLAAFGLRPDVAAREARLEGELLWSPQAAVPLATLGGHLHMQMENGVAANAGAPGEPFALLAVPALLAAGTDAGEAGQLHFTRLSADYELHDGVASTADMHFDGDAEILVRGQVGLVSRDYDQQAWVLRGEDRLPAALRRLWPTPRVAAAWLSLRELFAATAPERSHPTLRLRGSWNDPIVTPAE